MRAWPRRVRYATRTSAVSSSSRTGRPSQPRLGDSSTIATRVPSSVHSGTESVGSSSAIISREVHGTVATVAMPSLR